MMSTPSTWPEKRAPGLGLCQEFQQSFRVHGFVEEKTRASIENGFAQR